MRIRTIAVVGGLICAMCAPAGAVTKTPRSLYVLDLHGGYSTPFGSYTGIGPISIDNLESISASDLYDPTYHVGLNLGRLSDEHLYFGLGFQYTSIKTDKQIVLTPTTLKFSQFDFNFDFNYYPASPQTESFAPYFGPGLVIGLTTAHASGYRSETQVALGANLNFGADFRVWKAQDGRSLVTLSSVNSWNLIAGGDRPRYLNIGGALRYFFRP
jgi:hypothetical protein